MLKDNAKRALAVSLSLAMAVQFGFADSYYTNALADEEAVVEQETASQDETTETPAVVDEPATTDTETSVEEATTTETAEEPVQEETTEQPVAEDDSIELRTLCFDILHEFGSLYFQM